MNNQSISTLQITDVGVPQGSVLGPVLFLLYYNDIDKITIPASLTIYADDTSVLISDKDHEALTQKCDNVLSGMSDSLNANCLFLYTEKNKSVRFHNRQRQCEIVDLGDRNITMNENVVKFLGLSVDECLTWSNHCDSLICKLHSIAYQIKNIRKVLARDQLVNLYYAQVDSRLWYGICLWGLSASHKMFSLLRKEFSEVWQIYLAEIHAKMLLGQTEY